MGRLFDFNRAASASAGDLSDESTDKYQLHMLVRQTVETLPEDQREAFQLKFERNLDYREIGCIMDRSISTVNKLLSMALAEIRTQLREVVDLAKVG